MTRLRALLREVVEANPALCLDDAHDREQLLERLLASIEASDEAQLVRAALGSDPRCWVVRMASAHGGDQHEVFAAAYALAGGEEPGDA